MTGSEDGSGEKLTEREHEPMKVDENINENELRNQSRPADRNTLKFVFHWFVVPVPCSLNRKDLTLLNDLKSDCVKSKAYTI